MRHQSLDEIARDREDMKCDNLDALAALGFNSGGYERKVREALLELRHARASLAKFRKEREDEERDMGDGKIIVSYDAWMDCQRRAKEAKRAAEIAFDYGMN